MKTKNYLAAIVITLFLATCGFAQNSFPTIKTATDLYQKGDYSTAISQLKTFVKFNKNDGEAFFLLGMSQLQERDLKNARKSLQKAAKLLPQDARPVSGMSYLALLRGKNGEAKKHAQTAINLNPKDAEAHYFLGVVYFREGKEDAAIKSADASINLNPKLALPYLLKAEATIYDEGERWYISASPAERTRRFTVAAEILEKYPDMNSDDIAAVKLRERLSAFKVFADYFSKRENQTDNTTTTPSQPDPSVEPLKILSSPRASYTEDARKNGTTGTIRMVILFAKDGKTLYPIVLNGLKNGLIEQAMRAARQIKFVPAKKNGEPYSIVRMIEYGFNIY